MYDSLSCFQSSCLVTNFNPNVLFFIFICKKSYNQRITIRNVLCFFQQAVLLCNVFFNLF